MANLGENGQSNLLSLLRSGAQIEKPDKEEEKMQWIRDHVWQLFSGCLLLVLFLCTLSIIGVGIYAYQITQKEPVVVEKEVVVEREVPAEVVKEVVVTATPEPPTPYTVLPTPTPYPVVATPTSIPPIGSNGVPYEQEGGIPYSGTSWSADVAPDEVEVLTAGPANIAGVVLPGGIDRGSVIVLLSDPTKVVHYTVANLVTGANWHGAYRLASPRDEATWRAIANDRVQAMMAVPNCTSGRGCAVVDVLVVSPTGVVAQWTVK